MTRAGPESNPGEDSLQVAYRELRGIARGLLRRERRGHTLDPTGLVHEVWIKLLGATEEEHPGRARYLARCTHAMRQVLIDHARAKATDKRRHEREDRAALDLPGPAGLPAAEVLAVDEAIEALAEERPRWARVVELRFFAGLTLEEIAGVLEVSLTTVETDWTSAKAWLARRLDARPPGP